MKKPNNAGEGQAPGEKTGFYFGTFNPIHNAHIAIAQHAQDQFGLESIVFIPAGNPPLKNNDPEMASAEDRLGMVQLGIEGRRGWIVDPVELEDKGPSYTAQTLRNIWPKYDLGNTKMQFIIGSDALADLHLWHKPIEVARQVCFLQAPRPGTPPIKILEINDMLIPLDTRIINMPENKSSSTTVRIQYLQGKDIAELVPRPVFEYIQTHRPWKR